MAIILSIILAVQILMVSLFYFGLETAALYTAYGAIVFALILIIFWLQQAYSVIFLGNAPYVRTNKKMIKKILAEIEIKPNSVVYELGCGDARFLRSLVKIKNIQAVGYEYFFPAYLLARLFTFFQNKKITLLYQDFFKTDFSAADYIFCFLMPAPMARLENKLLRELKPGAMVISNSFPFKNWILHKKIILNPQKQALSNKLYIYKR